MGSREITHSNILKHSLERIHPISRRSIASPKVSFDGSAYSGVLSLPPIQKPWCSNIVAHKLAHRLFCGGTNG